MKKYYFFNFILFLFLSVQIKAQIALDLPENGATGVPVSATLSWIADLQPGVTSYRLQVDTDDQFTEPFEFNQNVGNVLTYDVPGLVNNRTYYWRVSSNISGYQTPRSFTTEIAIPVLMLPEDNANDQPTVVFIGWNPMGTVEDVTFDLQYDTDDELDINCTTVPNISIGYMLTGLINNSTYTWRIVAKKNGETDKISLSNSFTTQLAQPELLSPDNNATDLTFPIELTWSLPGRTDGVTFELQYFTLSGESTTIPEVTSPYSFTGLYGTNYGWRIMAKKPGAADKISEGRTFMTRLQPSVGTSPVNGAAGVSLNPMFQWTEVPGAVTYYLMYGTTNPPSSYVEVGNVVSYTLPDALPGNKTIYWQIVAKFGLGLISSSEIYSFITESDLKLIEPTDDLVGVSNLPTFTWSAEAGASQYRLQVSEDSTFSTFVFNQNIGNFTTYTLTAALDNSTIYYWRVRSDVSPEGVFTDPWSFTTELSVPVLSEPLKFATIISDSTLLKWSTINGADKYTLVINDTTIPEILTNQYNIINLKHDTVYVWKVRAEANSGNISQFSEQFSFVVHLSPYNLTLLYPQNNSTGLSLTPILEWAANLSSSYRVQVSTTNDFTNIVYAVNNYSSTNIQIPGPLTASTDYFWRVKAFNDSDSSEYSETFKFTTSASGELNIPVPVLSWVIGGATAFSINPTLYWYSSSYMANLAYELQYSTDKSLVANVSVKEDLSGNNYQLSNLLSGTIYYWRMRARFNGQYSAYSAIDSFKTTPGNNGPIVPVVTYPIGGVYVYSETPTLYWYAPYSGSDFTFEYRVAKSLQELSASAPFSSSGSNVEVSGLDGGTKYFWQVRSFDGVSYSEYSSPDSFIVYSTNTEPAIPTQSWPVGGAMVYSNTTSLYWYVVPWSSEFTYQIEYNTDNEFTGNPDIANISELNYEVSGLAGSTKYYWKIRSTDGSDFSEWSPADSFETIGSGSVVVPTPSWPIGGALVYSTTASLYWFTGTGGTFTYQVRYSTNPDLSDSIFIQNIQTMNTELTGLEMGATYYWQVRSFDGSVYSSWSDIESFSVYNPDGPMIPLIGSPARNVALTTNSLYLSWFTPMNSSNVQYEVEYSDNANMNNVVKVSSDKTNQLIDLAASGKYYWRVRAKSNDGKFSKFSPTGSFNLKSLTNVENKKVIPGEFLLAQNYPNPFNPTTIIKYGLPKENFITIKIYNCLGQEILTLLSENKKAGEYTITFNAENLPSGIYFYRLTGQNVNVTRKMILMR